MNGSGDMRNYLNLYVDVLNRSDEQKKKQMSASQQSENNARKVLRPVSLEQMNTAQTVPKAPQTNNRTQIATTTKPANTHKGTPYIPPKRPWRFDSITINTPQDFPRALERGYEVLSIKHKDSLEPAMRQFCYRESSRNQFARLGYAYCVLYGWGGAADRELGKKLFFKLAQEGMTEAQYEMGCIYDFGPGEKDYETILRWWLKAASQGYAHAENRLGHFYLCGYLGEPNVLEAVGWYQRAVDHGYPIAMTNLASHYARGWYIPQDNIKAMELYKKALALGEETAKECIQELYVRCPHCEAEFSRVERGYGLNKKWVCSQCGKDHWQFAEE